MRARLISFGLIEVEGRHYEHDVVIDAGAVRERRKKPSKPFAERFGHTPLSVAEKLPWKSALLIIGTGVSGQMPIMDDVLSEAQRRGVEVIALPTREACLRLADVPSHQASAVLHVTC